MLHDSATAGTKAAGNVAFKVGDVYETEEALAKGTAVSPGQA
jgi:hypothetical protein